MKITQLLKEALSEINPNQAYTDIDSLQTVVDGLRDVGFYIAFNSENKRTLEKAVERGLKAVKVPSNPYNAYVVYNPGAEREAQELLSIAEKHEGYLPAGPPEGDEETVRRIGQLLSYNEDSIDTFIKRNFK